MATPYAHHMIPYYIYRAVDYIARRVHACPGLDVAMAERADARLVRYEHEMESAALQGDVDAMKEWGQRWWKAWRDVTWHHWRALPRRQRGSSGGRPGGM